MFNMLAVPSQFSQNRYPRGILCVDKIGSPDHRILCVDKTGSPGKPATPCWGYNIRPQRVLPKKTAIFMKIAPIVLIPYCRIDK